MSLWVVPLVMMIQKRFMWNFAAWAKEKNFLSALTVQLPEFLRPSQRLEGGEGYGLGDVSSLFFYCLSFLGQVPWILTRYIYRSEKRTFFALRSSSIGALLQRTSASAASSNTYPIYSHTPYFVNLSRRYFHSLYSFIHPSARFANHEVLDPSSMRRVDGWRCLGILGMFASENIHGTPGWPWF